MVHQCGQARQWQPDELEWLKQLAVYLAIALQQAALHQQLQEERTTRQQSEQRYANLVATAPVGIFRADSVGRCTYVNERWCQISGLSLEDAIGEGWKTGLHPDDAGRIGIGWHQLAEENHSFQLEYRFQDPDGKVTWVYGQAIAEHDAEGQVIGYISTITDISERKQSEEALQKSEAHYKALISAIPDLIMRSNQAGIYFECVAAPNFPVVGNQSALVGTHVSETLPADLAQKRMASIQRALQTQTLQVYEQDLTIEGKTRVEEVRVIPYHDDEVLLLIRDISDRSEVEERLRNLSDRLNLAVQSAKLGIWDWDVVNDQLLWDDRMYELYGAEPAYPAEAYATWEARVHPEDLQHCRIVTQQALAGERAYETEFRVCLPDGRIRHIESQALVQRGPDGLPLRMIGINCDISERVRLAAERKQAETALRSLMESTAAVTGQDFFSTLAQQLMLALDVQYVLITKLVEDHLQTLAYWKDGQSQPNINFAVAAAPCCSHAIQHGRFYCPEGLLQRFADYPLIQSLQAESYLGIPLTTLGGQRLGNLCILDNKPMPNIQWAEVFLSIFSMRAAAELERQQAIEAMETLNHDLENRVEQRTAALRTSERQLSIIFNQAAVGMNVVALDGQYLKANQKLCDILGYTQKELLTKQFREVSDPEDVAQEESKRYQLYAGVIDSFSLEKRYLHKNGSTIWANLTVSLVYKSSGEPDYSIGVVEDISERVRLEVERKQAAEALQHSEEKFRQLAENIQSAFWISNANCNEILYISPAYEEIWGRSCQSLYASPPSFVEAIHPEDKARVLTVLTNQDQGYDQEYRILQPNGTIRWVRDRAFPIYNEEGVIYRLAGIAEDITERKQSEMELKTQQAFLRRLLDTVPNLIFVKNWEGQFTLVNQSTAKVYRTTVENLVGKTDADFNPNLAEVEGFLAVDREVMTTMQTRVREETVTSPNGEHRYFQTIKTPIIAADGSSKEILGVATDISDRKQVEEQLRCTNEQLAQANLHLVRATQLKDEFLANMSHELRTPLNAILGMTEGLQEQIFGEITERQSKALKTIEHSGFHLLELINDILDVARIEAGQMELDCTPTAVAPLCQSSLTFVRQQALTKQIRLDIKLPLNLPALLVDERRIRQVLINLLNNAVKFTPEGGHVTLEVTSLNALEEALAKPSFLRIAVIDTGIGIAPEHSNQLFQPFIQIDSALNRKYQGTGLGLALVKRIVELHGGQVGLTSEEGAGSCFTIDLPCVAAPLTATASLALPQPSGEPHQPEPDNAPLILIVEDNETNIMMVSSYLQAKGYRALLANNGQQAISLAQAHRPDLILMDIQMPDMDGLEAIQHLRRDPCLVSVPIIALTALAMTGDRERCLTAGANDYVTKPIKLKQLTELLATLLLEGAQAQPN